MPSASLSIKTWLDKADELLKLAGIESARLDAIILLESVLNRDRAWILAHAETPIAINQVKKLNNLLRRRQKREPLAYIIGKKEFYGLEFSVNSNVLIPRPESEVMVEYVIDHAPNGAALAEIGTGSGCIGLAVGRMRPDITLSLADISAEALKTARHNARRLNVPATFIRSDLMEAFDGLFDVIAANLPYVPGSVTRRQPELDYEPAVALYAGADGLKLYRRFLPLALTRLNKGGWLIIEASPTQRSELARLSDELNSNLTPISPYVFVVKPRLN